jgi:outer membrane protein TolC
VRGGVSAALGIAAAALALGWGAPRALAQDEAGAAPAAVLTLEEAVRLAQVHGPGVVTASGQVRGARSAERVAVGSWLPDLGFTAGTSRSSTQRFDPATNRTVSGSEDSYRAGLGSSLELYDGGRRGAERTRARAETAAAEAGLEAERFDVALEAKRAYFEELRAADLQRVAEARVRRAEEGLAASERRLDVGAATRSDVLRSRLELNEARRELLEAASLRRTAAHVLGRLVGADGPVQAAGGEARGPRPLALEEAELEALAVESSPGVRAAGADLRAAEAGIAVAGSAWLPSLRLSAGTDWFNQDPEIDGGRLGWDVGLGISYPIFDRWERSAAVTRADAAADAARARLADARRGARAELERLRGELDLAQRSVELAGEAVEVAEEDLRVQLQRYALGAATILDRIASQEALAEAESRQVVSRHDYELVRAELEALVGREL